MKGQGLRQHGPAAAPPPSRRLSSLAHYMMAKGPEGDDAEEPAWRPALRRDQRETFNAEMDKRQAARRASAANAQAAAAALNKALPANGDTGAAGGGGDASPYSPYMASLAALDSPRPAPEAASPYDLPLALSASPTFAAASGTPAADVGAASQLPAAVRLTLSAHCLSVEAARGSSWGGLARRPCQRSLTRRSLRRQLRLTRTDRKASRRCRWGWVSLVPSL